jgi:outer membrane protein
MKNKKLIASCMLALSLVGCTGLEAGNGGYTLLVELLVELHLELLQDK